MIRRPIGSAPLSAYSPAVPFMSSSFAAGCTNSTLFPSGSCTSNHALPSLPFFTSSGTVTPFAFRYARISSVFFVMYAR